MRRQEQGSTQEQKYSAALYSPPQIVRRSVENAIASMDMLPSIIGGMTMEQEDLVAQATELLELALALFSGDNDAVAVPQEGQQERKELQQRQQDPSQQSKAARLSRKNSSDDILEEAAYIVSKQDTFEMPSPSKSSVKIAPDIERAKEIAPTPTGDTTNSITQEPINAPTVTTAGNSTNSGTNPNVRFLKRSLAKFKVKVQPLEKENMRKLWRMLYRIMNKVKRSNHCMYIFLRMW
jgi:hypothetical protein